MAGGLDAEITRTVGSVGAQHWILSTNADGRITAASVFPQSDQAQIAHAPGVTQADALLILPQQDARIGVSNKTVNVFGVQPGGMGDPRVSSGQNLTGPGQVVASTASTARVGDDISFGNTHFEVVGKVRGMTMLGGGPIFFMGLQDAQNFALGGRPLVTAVVTRGNSAVAPPGLAAFSTAEVERNARTDLSGAIKSIDNSKVFMWLVAAIIIAALLYVSALQRLRDFAVLKALGSSSALLFSSLAVQAVFVALLAAAFATVISNFMGGLFAQPVAIPVSSFATMPVVAVVVGLGSSLFALRRVTAADPATAFGA